VHPTTTTRTKHRIIDESSPVTREVVDRKQPKLCGSIRRTHATPDNAGMSVVRLGYTLDHLEAYKCGNDLYAVK
jgi:hypothetical protein